MEKSQDRLRVDIIWAETMSYVQDIVDEILHIHLPDEPTQQDKEEFLKNLREEIIKRDPTTTIPEVAKLKTENSSSNSNDTLRACEVDAEWVKTMICVQNMVENILPPDISLAPEPPESQKRAFISALRKKLEQSVSQAIPNIPQSLQQAQSEGPAKNNPLEKKEALNTTSLVKVFFNIQHWCRNFNGNKEEKEIFRALELDRGAELAADLCGDFEGFPTLQDISKTLSSAEASSFFRAMRVIEVLNRTGTANVSSFFTFVDYTQQLLDASEKLGCELIIPELLCGLSGAGTQSGYGRELIGVPGFRAAVQKTADDMPGKHFVVDFGYTGYKLNGNLERQPKIHLYE